MSIIVRVACFMLIIPSFYEKMHRLRELNSFPKTYI